MSTYSKYIVEEFAQIFEYAMTDDELDMQSYIRYRDDFYQLTRSRIARSEENIHDIELCFARIPDISNHEILVFAAGNAEYYTRILNIPPPAWCYQVPAFDDMQVPLFAFPRIISDLDIAIQNTPDELYKRGFIYDEHNFEIY